MKKLIIMIFILCCSAQTAVAAASCGFSDPVIVSGHNGGNPRYDQILLRGKVWIGNPDQWVST